jgi:hypothetical protein
MTATTTVPEPIKSIEDAIESLRFARDHYGIIWEQQRWLNEAMHLAEKAAVSIRAENSDL